MYAVNKELHEEMISNQLYLAHYFTNVNQEN